MQEAANLKEKENEIYFTTKEASDKLGMESSLLRYYCNQFENFIPIKKTEKGYRLFTEENINNLQSIFDLMKDRGMTVKQVSYYLNEHGLALKKWDIPYPSLNDLNNLTDLMLKMKEEIKELREETRSFKENQKDTNDKLMGAMIQIAATQEESLGRLNSGLDNIEEIATYQRRLLPEPKKKLFNFWGFKRLKIN
ncbi:MAG: helix-turn-helix domain-containing protein [bacterium]